MLYTYTAKKDNGETYTGEVEAQGKIEVYSKVRAEGGFILSVREKPRGINISTGSFFTGIKTQDKIIFAKNLGSMLSAGLSITRALEVMEKQARSKALKKLLADLGRDVSKGEALSEVLKKHTKVFPSIFISMVKAGEESGNLSDSLQVISSQMEKSHMLTKRIRGAMIYPGVILSLMVVIAILLLIYMVPTLTDTFKSLNIELPTSTKIIIAASDFMVSHTLVALGGLVFIVVSVMAFLKSKMGKAISDRVFVRLPVIGEISKEINSARTARTIASLLAAGVSIVDAIGVSEEVLPNNLYKKALREAHETIQKGEALSAVFNKYESIYPPFVAEMTAVGEETGKISEMLMKVAVYYEEDVDAKTKDLSTIIEPILMIVIGVGVAVFALSMLAPTYSLVDSI